MGEKATMGKMFRAACPEGTGLPTVRGLAPVVVVMPAPPPLPAPEDEDMADVDGEMVLLR